MGVVERYHGLEPTADNLRMVLGDDAARLMIEAFGGQDIYVPRNPGDHHPITAVIGPDAAASLAAAWPAEEISIPMRVALREAILRLAAEGQTRAKIARQLRVTVRCVYKALAAAKTPTPRAPDLFD